MLITNFSAGELSKKLYGRIDLAIYAQGASRIENFEIIPSGGLTRRPGTRRIGATGGPARIIPFIITSTTTFLLEIGPSYIRIWKDGTPLTDGSGNLVQFVNQLHMPLYSSLAEAREVHYAQMYDELWLVHKSYPPYVLKWVGASSFTLTRPSFTANAYHLNSDGTKTEQSPPFTSDGNYPGVIAFFLGRLFMGGSINEPQRIWASQPFKYTNFVEYETIGTTSSALKDPDLHLFTATATKDSDTLTAVSQSYGAISGLTSYFVSGTGIPIGTKVVSVDTMLKTLKMSAKATLSTTDGAFTIQRWSDPTTPTAEDYESKTVSNDVTAAASAFYFEIASDKNDGIKWMSPQADLVIGTESSEWVVPASVTALNIQATLNSRTGSSPIQATMLGPATLFFQQGERAIREYYYASDTETYQATNLATWAPHILTESPAVDFDYTNAPHARILITRADGTLCVLLYERDMQVQGWYRIKLAEGSIISCATTQSDSGVDTIYLVVSRPEGYFLEMLQDDDTTYLDSRTAMPSFNPDTVASYRTSATLHNLVTDVYCKASAIPEGFYSAGQEIEIGYEYESVMESLPVLADAKNATKRIVSLTIRFLDSIIPYISEPGGPEELPVEIEPFSGVVKIPFPGDFDRDVFFKIRASKPGPCTALAVFADIQ